MAIAYAKALQYSVSSVLRLLVGNRVVKAATTVAYTNTMAQTHPIGSHNGKTLGF